MNGIKLSNVTYHYQKQTVFSDVSLNIAKEKITCLVGANGSGKSTLLKLLAGLLSPHHGMITLDGVKLPSYSRKSLAKKLAFLPQQCRLPPSLTVREYVALGRFCHQSWFARPTDADLNAAEQAITLTDLHALADKPVTNLSAGQQQRARMALMLAQEADYLLLDEPMTGLDLKQQRNMLKMLCLLQTQYKKTIILILHDLHQAMEISNEVIMLKNGVILGQGHPQEMIHADYVSKVFDFDWDIMPAALQLFPHRG